MADTVNMGIELPTPGGDEGVWDDKLNAALEVIDAHDHTAGKGVLVPSAGININDDLQFNSNRPIEIDAAQFDDLSVAYTGTTNARAVQFAGGDLWITNGSGVAVQITSGSSTVAPSSSNTPPGIVLPYAGSSAPAGYLLCDGSAVSRTTFAALFGITGTTFGVGDGSTTFNLPFMNGRVPMGTGTYTDSVSGSVTRTLGQQIGAEKHVITVAEMASHNHGGGAHTHTLAVNGGDGTLDTVIASGARNNFTASATGAPIGSSGSILSTVGSNTAHNNMQPSLGLNYIIKT